MADNRESVIYECRTSRRAKSLSTKSLCLQTLLALSGCKISKAKCEHAVDCYLSPAVRIQKAGIGRVRQDQSVEAIGNQASDHRRLQRFRAFAVASAPVDDGERKDR